MTTGAHAICCGDDAQHQAHWWGDGTRFCYGKGMTDLYGNLITDVRDL